MNRNYKWGLEIRKYKTAKNGSYSISLGSHCLSKWESVWQWASFCSPHTSPLFQVLYGHGLTMAAPPVLHVFLEEKPSRIQPASLPSNNSKLLKNSLAQFSTEVHPWAQQQCIGNVRVPLTNAAAEAHSWNGVITSQTRWAYAEHVSQKTSTPPRENSDEYNRAQLWETSPSLYTTTRWLLSSAFESET